MAAGGCPCLAGGRKPRPAPPAQAAGGGPCLAGGGPRPTISPAQKILVARPTPRVRNPGVCKTLAASTKASSIDATCMHVGCGSNEAWASGWALLEPREPTTIAVSDPLSRPNSEFKRALLAARIALADLATGARPFFPFFFRVTRVYDSGINSNKVTGSRITLGIGPIQGFTVGLGR